MNQTFFQKLQRVHGEDLVHILLFLFAIPFALICRWRYGEFWLICENKEEARDNGYWLYRYIKENHPEKRVIYAISKKSPDYLKVKQLGEVVDYGSFSHWVLYLAAAKNISSQKGGKPNAAVCHVLEVSGLLKNTRIFLQHGVIMNDLEFLHYKNTRMRMFMCTAEREYEYVKSKFGYPENWVQCPGICRYDNLIDCSQGKRVLLVMPTWRNWISKPTSKSKIIEKSESFTETEYFRAWNDFLCSSELGELLEKNDYRLIFYLHRDMQKYQDKFGHTSDRIEMAGWPEADVQDLLKTSNILVTDYSSVAMDFGYLNKPLLYYQFDYERFRKGQYAEGYFSYQDDGFGPVCEDQNSLMKELRILFQNDLEDDRMYAERRENFFKIHDQMNCRRNYECIDSI